MSHGQLKLFSGSAHPALAKEIAEQLEVPLGAARLHRFPDSEVSFQIDENIRGTDVFVIQPTCPSVDEHIMELLVMIDAFRRSSAARITAVIPYYGYARQDRKDKPRVPISAKLVADLLSTAGTDRVLTMDLHAAQIQGFFDVPVDHLFAAPVIIDHVSQLDLPELTVVSPEEPDGTELLLEPDTHPVVGPFRTALVEDGIPATSFAVADVQTEYERLLSQGVRFVQPPVDHGTVVTAVLDDTCGNLIQIAAERSSS